jgi:carbonic anhydrase
MSQVIRRAALAGLIVWTTGAFAQKPVSTDHKAVVPAVNPDQVLSALKAGNQRFRTHHATHPHVSSNWIVKNAKEGQHPKAVLLSCSDSRVPPEILFDQGVGDLFAIRVAGNVANNDEIASAGYAIGHLGAPLVVVMGHTKCGAVTAVVEGAKLPAELEHLVAHIRDAAVKAHQEYPGLQGPELVEATVKVNVMQAVHDLIHGNAEIRERVKEGKLKIVGAVYDISTGIVEWLGPHPEEKTLLVQSEPTTSARR